MQIEREKPRVLMIGPAPEVKGGISAVVQSYLASDLVNKVDLIYLVTHVDGNRWTKFVVAMTACLRFPVLCFMHSPDVVHIHFSSYISFYRKLVFFILAKLIGMKVLVHVHSGIFDRFRDSGKMHAFFIEWIFEKADRVIALSKNWEKLLRSYAPNARIRLLYNPVPTSLYAESTPWNHRLPELQVLFMGRLGNQKGTYDIIRAIPSVLARNEKIRFVFAGDGEIEKAVALCEKAGLMEHVEFPGWLEGDDKVRRFRESDIFLLPSYGEGIPVSVLEAMASGLPVICTPVGGIPDAIEDNVNGCIVDPGDVEMIARKINELSSSREARERIGMENKRKCKELFDIEIVASKLFSMYREMTA